MAAASRVTRLKLPVFRLRTVPAACPDRSQSRLTGRASSRIMRLKRVRWFQLCRLTDTAGSAANRLRSPASTG